MSVRNLIKTASLIPQSKGIHKFDPYQLLLSYYKSYDKTDMYNFFRNSDYDFEDGRNKYHIYEDHKSKLYFIEWLPFSSTDIHNHPHQTSFMLLQGLLKENVYLENNKFENILFESNSSKLTENEYHKVESLYFKSITLHIDIF
tara:strand:- start:91 stop:522 length:432 start_codon:yes stop_codon:yes gene_type:complete